MLISANPKLLNLKDKRGLTPLHYAATNNLEVVKFFVQKGADIDAQGFNGTTPLYSSARFGKIEIAKYLLDTGADINLRGEGGSALHQAVARSPKEMVELFLSYKPDLTITDKRGQTVMHAAATWNAHEVLPLLIAAGGNINAIDSAGNTPLHCCLTFADDQSRGSIQSAKILIQNKALLKVKNKEGLTPLALANKLGTTEMAALLSEAELEK